MDDYYILEWRFRDPGPLLYNYWRRDGIYIGPTLVTELNEEQLRQQVRNIKDNENIEFRVVQVTHTVVDSERFI